MAISHVFFETVWALNGNQHPGNRSKQFQESHKITTPKFECKTLAVCEVLHACCFSVKLCWGYSVSFLELFGPIAGVIISITHSLLLRIGGRTFEHAFKSWEQKNGITLQIFGEIANFTVWFYCPWTTTTTNISVWLSKWISM